MWLSLSLYCINTCHDQRPFRFCVHNSSGRRNMADQVEASCECVCVRACVRVYILDAYIYVPVAIPNLSLTMLFHL